MVISFRCHISVKKLDLRVILGDKTKVVNVRESIRAIILRNSNLASQFGSYTFNSWAAVPEMFGTANRSSEF